MSTHASIDFKINPKEPYYIVNLLTCFCSNGWEVNTKGGGLYLPKGESDFDWQNINITKSALFAELKYKEKNQEFIGITLEWNNETTGIEFLYGFDNLISVNLNINRKVNSHNMTDINWYLDRLIPCLISEDLGLESVTFEQHGV